MAEFGKPRSVKESGVCVLDLQAGHIRRKGVWVSDSRLTLLPKALEEDMLVAIAFYTFLFLI